jgi:hypothetical protein
MITYELARELPSYLKKHFPTQQALGSILTLTGGTIDAYTASCKNNLVDSEAGMFEACILQIEIN